jgi:hypothetical protein
LRSTPSALGSGRRFVAWRVVPDERAGSARENDPCTRGATA